VPEIRDRIYKSVADTIKMAAALSVLAHLESLVERGLAASSGPVSLDARYIAVAGHERAKA
jgi:hypothetical protein